MVAILNALTRLTTPLLPDDYLSLVNPMLCSTGFRARIRSVTHETGDAVTIALRPSRTLARHRAGQYIRLGIDIGGVRHWRSYSLTSPEAPSDDYLTITVKAVADGVMSQHLKHRTKPGDIVYLEPPSGDFLLSTPMPARILLVAAGSGITPIMSMLRTIETSPTPPDTELVVCAPTSSNMIFGRQLRSLASRYSWLSLHERHTRCDGRLDFTTLADTVADWSMRPTWMCGPAAMLDAAVEHWASRGMSHQLHIERFQAVVLTTGGAGGHVTFGRSKIECDVGGDTTLLHAGEAAGVLMPNGCRMGICYTCVRPLVSGKVRDVRSGDIHGEPGEPIQTCVSAPASTLEIDI